MECNIPKIGLKHCRHGFEMSTHHTNRLFFAFFAGGGSFPCIELYRLSQLIQA
jgi:hypothetical protein